MRMLLATECQNIRFVEVQRIAGRTVFSCLTDCLYFAGTNWYHILWRICLCLIGIFALYLTFPSLYLPLFMELTSPT